MGRLHLFLKERRGNGRMKRRKMYFRFIVLIISLCCIMIIVFLKKWQREETKRFVKQLGPGFNLGNTLDTHDLHFETKNPSDFETYWGNPVTTREMIQDIKAAGFNVLRVPVTWYEHMDENGMIDEVWLHRVQQVVDYGLQAGMYVIINSHHDSWYTPVDEHLPKARENMNRLWSQIAERFKEYDQRLLFESMNEPRLIGKKEEWGEGTPRSRQIINELNETFVETVRASGGQNVNRYLILPTYCARTDEVILKDFRLPKGNKLILSIHLYLPYEFCLNIKGTSKFNQKDFMDTEEIDKVFKDLNRLFVSKGVPVIITEFSAVDKKNEQQRIAWACYIREQAEKLGIAYVWWDAGPGEEQDKPFPLYNRHTRKWLFTNLKDALTE